jgi:hypothetical protein
MAGEVARCVRDVNRLQTPAASALLAVAGDQLTGGGPGCQLSLTGTRPSGHASGLVRVAVQGAVAEASQAHSSALTRSGASFCTKWPASSRTRIFGRAGYFLYPQAAAAARR